MDPENDMAIEYIDDPTPNGGPVQPPDTDHPEETNVDPPQKHVVAQPHAKVKPQRKRNGKPKGAGNPLCIAIKEFILRSIPENERLSTYPSESAFVGFPKRYSVYPPLLLLHAEFYQSSETWERFVQDLAPALLSAMWAHIADCFKKFGVKHIAINGPIKSTSIGGGLNIERVPAELVPVFGGFDFQPGLLPQSPYHITTYRYPTKETFDSVLWISDARNGGILQTWAPSFTMFSRGNLSEKVRIGDENSNFDGLDGKGGLLNQYLEDISVVDMYVGVGYFAFSYLKRGVARVWGWELSPWSVEGLKRGCTANGWVCLVVEVGKEGEEISVTKISNDVEHLAKQLRPEDKMVVFHGDNKYAAIVMRMVQDAMTKKEWKSIRHINMGLLPDCQKAWGQAMEILDTDRGGWIHVHENVKEKEIEARKEGIVEAFRAMTVDASGKASEKQVDCVHVEKVKSYGPGVKHCVFDIRVHTHIDW